MEIFINESSLHSQYYDVAHYKEALRDIINSLDTISKIKNSHLLRSDLLFYSSGLGDINLSNLLKNNGDISVAFKGAIQRSNIKSWQLEQKHSLQDVFDYNQTNYSGYSIAELAERKLIDKSVNGFLLNFSNSTFSNLSAIVVIKNNTDEVLLDCIDNSISMFDWLVDNEYLKKEENYDESSGLPPIDLQTILKNEAIFELTTYPKNNGRKIYRKINTNQLWVVDGSKKHAGKNAHIEVFDENTRNHLGTSIYNQDSLNESFKKDNRTIYLG